MVLQSVYTWPPYKENNYLKTKYCFFIAEVSHEVTRTERVSSSLRQRPLLAGNSGGTERVHKLSTIIKLFDVNWF